MLGRIIPLLAASAMVLAVAGCDGDKPPESTPTATATTSPTESPTTSPTVPAYLKDYSEEERAAYQSAVADYERFADRNARIYAAGVATSQVKAFYQQKTAAWQSYWAQLQQLEADGIRIKGRAETVRIRPVGVRATDRGGAVTLRVCSVSTGVEVIQNGTPVPQPTPKPTVIRVEMVQLPGEDWWRILSDRLGGPC
jgi:hypothetical protein